MKQPDFQMYVPELEVTSLEDINNERILDLQDQEDRPQVYYMTPEESLRFE